MAKFSLDNFRAEVLARGLAKSNRFEVTITPPPAVSALADGRLVSLMAESATLPPTRIITSQQRIFGPPSQHPQSADYGGENLTIQFYLDREMKVKRFFDYWVDGIVGRRTSTVKYQAEYLCEGLTVAQLDELDLPMYTVKFTELYPIAVNPVQLDYNQANAVSRLAVTFTYRRWFVIEQNQTLPAQAPVNPRSQSTPDLRRNPPVTARPVNSNQTTNANPATQSGIKYKNPFIPQPQ